MKLENNIKPEDSRKAQDRAADFADSQSAAATPALISDADGLWLSAGGQKMRGNFTRLLPRTAKSNLNGELVVRAARPKKAPADGHVLTVLDATAGMGEDSFLLAAAGFEVTLYERDHTIFMLLADTIRRAAGDPATAEIASRMHLIEGDSIAAMRRLALKKSSTQSTISKTLPADSHAASASEKPASHPDVILLDPMFPERKKSGLVKKKFQLIHYLEAPCADEEALFDAARNVCPSRIVIKRPARGPFLAGQKPSFSLNGKTVRYDVLVLHDM